MARTLRNITFVYVVREDRILAAMNAGLREAWSCWLTRRLSLALLERATGYVQSSSGLAQRAPSELRGELHNFEREAAIANTAGAMSTTPPEVLQATVDWAELADRIAITQQGEGYRFELYGVSGDVAVGVLQRNEIQRVLQMLQAEVGKAGWLAPANPQATPAPAPDVPKPLRN